MTVTLVITFSLAALLSAAVAGWIGYRAGSRLADDDSYWQPLIPDEPAAPAARPPWVEYTGAPPPPVPRQVPAWARATMPGRAVPPSRPVPGSSPRHAASAPRITNGATYHLDGPRRLIRRLR